MGKGGRAVQEHPTDFLENITNEQTFDSESKRLFTWEQLNYHTRTQPNEYWIVVNGHVLDVTNFLRRHPGGTRLLKHYNGQNATEAFLAFHKHMEKTESMFKKYCIGRLDEQQEWSLVNRLSDGDLDVSKEEKVLANDFEKDKQLRNDFEQVRQLAVEKNLFEPSKLFFFSHFAHIVLIELIGFMIAYNFGINSWIPYFASILCYLVAESQAGWLQHDFGHSSVFPKTWMDKRFHQVFMGYFKGASSGWWNHLHFQHHAKPNCIGKDPDVRVDPVFIIGKHMVEKYAKRCSKVKYFLPYNWQHVYFVIAGPLLFPLFMGIMTIRHAFVRRDYKELFYISLFYFKFTYLIPAHGILMMMRYVFFLRMMESTWFTLVTQSNHVVMEIDEDKRDAWLPAQLRATCNIEQSFFNDWFTGHLNFQIEHHLFPRMPRHNLHKIAPKIKELCRKHSVRYEVKPLLGAFYDIVCTLEKFGQLWFEAYNEFIDMQNNVKAKEE
ncbi:hypothetical protein SNEBB_008966 [Seison nebaliae]|nr:hypothetical protein SNEBB_008966 [Seison nebaliae]